MAESEQIFEILNKNLEISKEIVRLLQKTTLPPNMFEKINELIRENEKQINDFKTK